MLGSVLYIYIVYNNFCHNNVILSWIAGYDDYLKYVVNLVQTFICILHLPRIYFIFTTHFYIYFCLYRYPYFLDIFYPSPPFHQRENPSGGRIEIELNVSPTKYDKSNTWTPLQRHIWSILFLLRSDLLWLVERQNIFPFIQLLFSLWQFKHLHLLVRKPFFIFHAYSQIVQSEHCIVLYTAFWLAVFRIRVRKLI